jgi:kinesin family member 6/9
VFERVARPVVQGALEGLNGTIFAYGQTGSGKTFTMTGGPERYVDRGIIPRSLSAIFAEVSKRSDYRYTVHVSYLEIYNEIGYDLLDPDREIMALEDLPRVHVMENDDNEISYRNLGVHPAATEEEALNLVSDND